MCVKFKKKKIENSGPQNVHEWTKEIYILKTFNSLSNPQNNKHTTF